MREAFQRFMAGRFGFQGWKDSFGIFLLFMAFAFLGTPFLWVLSPLMAGWEVIRMLSRNLPARGAEEMQFRKITGVVTGWLTPVWRLTGRVAAFLTGKVWRASHKTVLTVRQTRTRIKERKTHVFVNCPKCKNVLRLPKGKGRLSVTCPVCGNGFMKET